MDWDDELLLLVTLGAVLPYLSVAATQWVRRSCAQHWHRAQPSK